MKISDLVGNTPLVELRRLCPNPRVKLLAKMESHNPGGSVKDRPALSMIEGAEARGELKPGMKLIEPTSGNTGIALAMIACAKGYELELVMPENSTAERVWTMRAFGAKVTLTSAAGSMEEAIDYARAKVARGEAVMLDQFSNPDNWKAHYRGTGPELWRDTEGKLTHFVSSMGTTGTIMGVSRFLKEQSPAPTIVGVQPADGAKIPGIRRWPAEYLPKIYEAPRVDQIVDVAQHDAEETARRLAREEGVFCGMSAGGAAWAALQIAREIDEGVVAVIICDRGDRYLSSDLFRPEPS
ncbi:MAG: cysteine synthase CysM [Polyangiaceae bacterium]|jgi:cysteine synthase B|nr:cysteine synthase CysM [Polyangiaceae bacterium]